MQHVLIIGKVWPETRSSAAGSRMMQILGVFLSQNWKITFASAANRSEFSDDLAALGIQLVLIELNNTSFDSFVKELKPALVLFDRFTTEEQFGWRVAENCPNAMRILDTEDLHCLRAARQVALKEKRQVELNDLVSIISKREIASIYRCDLSLIISSYEMKVIQEVFKVDTFLLHYIPFLLEPLTQKTISAWPDFNARDHFISIGNFLHEPNWDAVLFLKQEIWPLIRKQMPKAQMHVYGAYPSQKVVELNDQNDGFFIKGRAETVNEVMLKARVCIAPLRFGAGLKGKLIDAMVCGTPNVTSGVGAEAMHEDYAWSGEIANTAQEIATAAIKLYQNEERWKHAQKNGITIINACFEKEKYSKEFITKINSIQKSINEHRLKNFTGAMLMQNTTLSSKYMALWIEAKNKLTKEN